MSLGSGSAPSPAPFKPTNIKQDQSLALAYNELGYNLSDSDFLARFPGLVALRDSTIQDASDQITAPLDPTVQNAFASTAQNTALSSFGAGSESIGPVGSAARGAIGTSIANQTQSKQDYDRLTLQNLIAANPQRQFSLPGGSAVDLMIANVLGGNQNRYASYASGVQTSNAQDAATTQNAFAAAGLAISLVSAIAL